jgi:hypothetical protein
MDNLMWESVRTQLEQAFWATPTVIQKIPEIGTKRQ